MKKIFILIWFLLSFVFENYSLAQSEDKLKLFQRFLKQYNSGDIIHAENTLQLLLKLKDELSQDQLATVFNNLGASYTLLGKFNSALDCYNNAENLIYKKSNKSGDLADIYINKAIIFGNQKSYNSAIEYFEKGIRIYLDTKNPDKSLFYRISTAYLNVGIVYYETGDNNNALKYLTKSTELKQRYQLTENAFVLLNIAKTYVKIKNFTEAEKFFKKSIQSCIKEFGNDYYRSAEIYFAYGFFQQLIGNTVEALEIHKRALNICLKNYGTKHTLVSLSYKYLGDDYLSQQVYDSVLYFYQKSLISVVEKFNSNDIFDNPSIDSSLYNIRLLDILKYKTQALYLFAGTKKNSEEKLNLTTKSLETIELALKLIDRIRNNYLSEESRIYLAENEKETYLFATQVAYNLYALNKDITTGYKMYSIAQKAKAAILRNEITGNDLLYSRGIPDSLHEKQNKLAGNIAAYNNLILEETRNVSPDNGKISLWKDALFEMNREKERVTGEIERVFPEYRYLLSRTKPDTLQQIQKKLHSDETILDYLISNQYSDGKRKLYVFIISRNSLNFSEQYVDSLFEKNAEIIRKTGNTSITLMPGTDYFGSYTGALNYMYNNLIRPFEKSFMGTRLIIIPDEEIAWLSFDAFLKNMPQPGQTDYEGLSYLVKDYIFSYGYSSSFIFGRNKSNLSGTKVFAFSPDYRNANVSGLAVSSLQSAGNEIGSVFKWFSGKAYSGENATKANFILALKESAVFHLAMHSMSDSMNSRYSYLMFDTHNMPAEDGKLYNYEISLARINSPMVVLSACNSGAGTLYSGEGLMSLARGFILAGASSVIKTSWEINDETSTMIITRFYYHLSKGKEKDVAMRLAKLEYLKNASPAFTNPYYWASYEILGETTRIATRKTGLAIALIFSVIIISGLVIIYLRRRRIFSERSR